MILIDLQELVKQTLDQITQTYANTNQIIGLVKESGRITDYQLSNNTIAEKTAGCVSIPREIAHLDRSN